MRGCVTPFGDRHALEMNREIVDRRHRFLQRTSQLVIDDAHHCRARTYRKIIEEYPEAIILGMTATPCRGDGRGLGNVFNCMVECPPVQELIDLGYLVPTRLTCSSLQPSRCRRSDCEKRLTLD